MQTFNGKLLIAVNPFKELQIYAEEIMEKYLKNDCKSIPPHIYSIGLYNNN